jgi:hypothetical protein
MQNENHIFLNNSAEINEAIVDREEATSLGDSEGFGEGITSGITSPVSSLFDDVSDFEEKDEDWE